MEALNYKLKNISLKNLTKKIFLIALVGYSAQQIKIKKGYDS